MKNINIYVNEKLKINNKVDKYNYHPKDRNELFFILHKRLNDGDKDFTDIDVSAVTDMSALFYELQQFDLNNINISNWDVSNVTTMNSICYKCRNFNADLSSWDVSNVKDFRYAFIYCKEFTGKGLNKWNVTASPKMQKDMFNGVNEKFPEIGWYPYTINRI